MQLNKFEPFSKNPPISKVFREIGYADELGSGMRNTNKYTKLYSGETPIFMEGNIFEIVIPMGNVAGLQVGPKQTNKENNKENSKENSKENNKENNKENSKKIAVEILGILEESPQISMKEISDELNVTSGRVRYYIELLKKSGRVEHKGSTKKGKWIVHKRD